MILHSDAELDGLYERTKDDRAIIVGSEIRGLIAEIRQHRAQKRSDRVDVTLAKRLGEHIRKDAALRVELRHWLACYATDIFPEPDLEKAADVLKANGMTIDQLSANMGRHVLKKVLEMLDRPVED
jgi:hypothetical protein